MIMLDNLHEEEIRKFGAALLRSQRESAKSFEEAAQHIVSDIHKTFTDHAGNPAFPLVRVYRMCQYDALPSDLKPLANAETSLWMTLMATCGLEPAWNDRRQSQGHKVVPAGDQRSPMVAAAFQQIGLDEAPSADGLTFSEATFMTRYFHVANAIDNPAIPAQAEFVRPYQIKSVIGLGARFMAGTAHLTLCFSRTPLNEQAARSFATLSAHVSTLLAFFDTRKIWHA
jgi:hypothetical protein